MRLSAARVTLGNAKLGRTAMATNLRGGQLSVTIGESEAFGGIVRGSLGLARAAEGASVKAQLQFADVDLDQCLGEIFGVRRLEGKGNLGFTLDSTGGSIYGLTKGLNGSASVTSRKGAIVGLNVEQLLRRVARSPLSVGGGGGNELRSGRTPYDQLTVNLKIDQGNIHVEDVHLDGPSIRLGIGGSASIPSRDLNLNGTAALLTTPPGASEAAASFELPFIVTGPWDDPLPLPDPKFLIQRSGSGNQLLQAIKNRAP
jgi:AsmA protein